MKVKIFQLNSTGLMKFGFMSYEFAQRNGFDLSHYSCVYECERNSTYTYDKAFREFNINRPKDFKGHSLSVSDIVELDGNMAYCDMDDWQIIA